METIFTFSLTGRIINLNNKPLGRLIVSAYDHDPDSPDDALGHAVTDANGIYTIRFAADMFNVGGKESGGPDLYITVYDGDTFVGKSSTYANAQTNSVIDLKVNYTPGGTQAKGAIEGRIVLEHKLPARNTKVRLYRKGFGGQAELVGESVTGDEGHYSFAYDRRGNAAALEVRAVDAQGKELTLSKPLYSSDSEERMEVNLIAPSSLQPNAPEYRRLADDLKMQLGELSKLAGAKENAERQDLTLLNRATGWDMRLIALAATAERLSAEPDVKLPQEMLYGLLRAGLPSDKLALAQVSPDAAENALRTVRDAGIVAFTDEQIKQHKASFTAFSDRTRLGITAPGSQATYGQLLKISGLTDDEQSRFAAVYLNHRGDAAGLWEKARQAGLGEQKIGRLKLQGKLAFLADNSEAVTTRLLQKVTDPAQLAEQDYHQPDKWKAELRSMAGTNAAKLAAAIPASYVGENTEARLNAYAEEMARKVRLSYPTQVVGRLIEQDTADAFKLGATRGSTVQLLKKAATAGFRLGETPVGTFLKANADVAAGLPASAAEAAGQQLRTLQRVYQITPSNEAMPVMLSLGMTSAYDVTAYSEQAFVDLYSSKYKEMYKKSPTEAETLLVYRKAKQVSSVTYNLFTAAKKLESEVPLHGLSAPVEAREKARSEIQGEFIKQFPTMESLFGSMDYCECEHCRSVLSPAAYLVDLFQFVDAEDEVWSGFLKQWETTHNNQSYDAKYKKPFVVLKNRRPDLPYLPLTCENTQTVLPYIDIVNEILEYYVANGELTKAAVRDTGELPSEELLAEPQYVIQEAYKRLLEARYPLQLPFDLWLETVRRFCGHFETPLAKVLEAFRPGDSLFAPSQPYDLSAVFLESLGLSPTEAEILTAPNPLADWHALYGYASAAEATTPTTDAASGQRTDLNSAKALARRLGVTYKELADIIQTGFVNPKLEKLALLYKLGVSVRDARFYLDNKTLIQQAPAVLSADARQRRLEAIAFSERLTALAGTFGIPAAQLEAQLQAIPFGQVLLLADPDAGSSFDLTELRYASGTPADAMAFLRINLFVRLWRKLGWSLEETDRALQVFIPKLAPFEAIHLNKRPLLTALIYMAHLKELEAKLQLGKQARLKLLTLWSDISVTGKSSLYAQLFLTRGVLKSDPVFDHPLGNYLTSGAFIKDHLPVLQGALGLTAEEVGSILGDAGLTLEQAKLTLPHVSLLYRYGLLAKGLKLSVRELIALKQLSGLDPFKPLPQVPLTAIEEDHPYTYTLRFVEAAEEIKASGMSTLDLDYLLRHRFDETGKYRPDREGMLSLLKSLSEGIRAIRAEHAIPAEPGALSGEELRQKLSLVLPSATVERFLAMLNGTAEFTAVAQGVSPGEELSPAEFADEPAIRELRYNETRQEQKLTFRGVLFETEKQQVLDRHPSEMLKALLSDVQEQARAFFGQHLQLTELQPQTGFLKAELFELLFDSRLPLEDGESEQDRQRNRQAALAEAFLPFLQERLIRRFIVQKLTAHTGADPALAESLINDGRLLSAPISLGAAFAGVGERGVTATYFASADGTGAQLSSFPMADADTGLKRPDGSLVKPAAAGSARFDGYIEVPASGAYRFYVALDKQGAEAELRFGHLPDPVFWRASAGTDNSELGNEPRQFLELKAGVPYRFSLLLNRLNGGNARLLVQGEALPKGSPAQLLYPLAAMEESERAAVLLAKALQLLQSLGLNEREARYLLTHAAAFDGLNLSLLPASAEEGTFARGQALFRQWRRLAGYARLKRELAGGLDSLIDIFEANGSSQPDRVYPLISKLARMDESEVKAAAKALFAAPAFPSEKPLARLWEALRIIQAFGISAASVADWTRIVSASATPAQRFAIARDLKEAVKARFETGTWHRIAQPIFDKLRQRQRDALAARVMHLLGFDRMEQLYEYFLIDPGMEPAVQSSRIRMAIGSMQLFIQRCLLNLEPQVHPSAINVGQWEWMKRYRVWEANRKIFLFPENWLEPEFRDDKTHLFGELEGALLQGDVTADLAEDAFLHYLKKLDELARLDIVAMHLEDHADPALRKLHVIGRTYSQPHKYFYRRYLHRMWTPWEPVSAEIEGDHLAPVVWRDRLYLFWVTFMDKPADNQPPSGTTSTTKMADATVGALYANVAFKQIQVQLHWSEYVGEEWSTRESGGWSAAISKTVAGSFNPKTVFVHVSKAYEDGEERGVYVHLGGALEKAFYLAGRNSEPAVRSYTSNGAMGGKPDNPYSAKTVRATRYEGSGVLHVTYNHRITTEAGKAPKTETESPGILQKSIGEYTLLPCDNNIEIGIPASAYEGADDPAGVKAALERSSRELATLSKPVFYQDSTHTLFLEPSVTEKTIGEVEEWITRTPQPELSWELPDWWKDLQIAPAIPFNPIDPVINIPFDTWSNIQPVDKIDWMINESTVLQFDEVYIAPERITADIGGTLTDGGILQAGTPQIGIPQGGIREAGIAGSPQLSGTLTTPAAKTYNVIGALGYQSTQLKNFQDSIKLSAGSTLFNQGGGFQR